MRQSSRFRVPWAWPAWLYLAATVLFVVSIAPYRHRNTGFTSFIRFGDQFAPQALPALGAVPRYVEPGSWGYDGQFYAQLALDPLLRDPALANALDTPPYRARRILFAWTAYLAGLGRPANIIRAYAWQNLVAWGLLAYLLLRWLPPTSARNFVAWFGCMFSAGFMDSIRSALLEGPSLLVIVLGIIAVESRRMWLGSALLGLAGLGRETNLLGCGILAGPMPRTWRALARTLGALLLAVTPLALWSAYVWSIYGASQTLGIDNLGLPFGAYVAKWQAVVGGLRREGWWGESRFVFVIITSLTVQAAFLLTNWTWREAWWRVGAAYGAFMPFVGSVVWEGRPGAAVRVLLPMTVAFNVMVLRSRWFWPLVILGNLSVLYGLQRIDVPWLAAYL